MSKSYLNHNGKEIKILEGVNVRVSKNVYEKVKKHCFNKGLKIGKFFEQAAEEKIKAK